MEARQQEEYYTYADYLTWEDGPRVELIDGEMYMMSSPTWQHQRISDELSRLLGNYLVGKPCVPFSAPLDIRFEDDDKADTVLQPDIVVICEREKLKPKGSIVGAPTLVIEVLSPSTMFYDMNCKALLYERMKVPEYWMIDGNSRTIYQCVLTGGLYGAADAIEEGRVVSSSIEGFGVDLQELFAVLDGY